MKIVYCTNLYYPYEIGGAEMYVKKLAESLASDHQVSVITTAPFSWKLVFRPAVEVIEGVTIYRFYPINISSVGGLRNVHPLFKPLWHFIDLYNVHARWMVSRILRQLRPDIVHTHNISGFSPSIFASIKRAKRKIIHTIHDYHFISPWSILYRNNSIITKFSIPDRLYRSYYRRVTQGIQIVTAPSQFVLSLHNKYGFFKQSQSIKIPLGIDQAQRQLARQSAEQRNHILYLGQITTYKGVGVLLDALALIPEISLSLKIAGTGPDFESLRKQCHDSRVEWLGFVRGEAKEQLLRTSSFSIVPSIWYDNSPVTIYESLVHGVPVVGSRIGGIPELVEDGKNGLLFDPGNSNQLAACLQKLVRQPDVLQSLQSGALESSSRYTQAGHLETLLNIYRALQ